MSCCTFARSVLCVMAWIVVLVAASSSHAQGPTCCGFSGNCYQPGVFGNCGGDTDVGSGVACSPSPCLGRCCNLTTGTCSIVGGSAAGSGSCNPGGFAFGVTTCAGSPCPPTGACCAGNGTCSVLTATGCGANVYLGNSSTCAAGNCVGACCDLVSGTCSLVGFSQCSGGQYHNLGSTCTTNLCTGACCSQLTGACTLTGPNGCTGNSTYVGVGSTCGVGTCPQPGACCAPVTFVCATVVQSLCVATSGTFNGVGSVCAPSPCPQPATPNAFTYQGRLTGGPANGTISARFTLWDNLTSTAIVNRIAGPTTVTGVTLTSSLFTAVVDFGSRLPTDRKTWLQVEVDTGSGFVSLNPRQLMTFAPLAAHAAAAAVAGTKSQTLCLGPGSYIALDSSKRVINNLFDGVWVANVGTDEIVAPINLPGGAVIDLVTAYVNDSATSDLEFFIVAKVNNGTSSFGVGPDFVATGSSGFFSKSVAASTVIDGNLAYSLRVFPAAGVGAGQWPGNNTLALMNVVITWHMP